MISRLHTLYRDQVRPKLVKVHHYPNALAVPQIVKIVVNVGFGKHVKDPKHQETTISTLTRITGQKPMTTKAKKSISAFKLRQGMVIGAKVTLRGEQMWEFLDKFIHVTLARVRDFHGIDPKSFGRGTTLTVGVKEHIVFPEIRSDEVEHLHGLEVSIVTSAHTTAEARDLLAALGFPFTRQP
ncbi:MAG: 50S ribosomal protein L5 [Candidatus Kerfeldbacteria bacterium]|nr:50S ribosomal protein L5 [Candidatus Kerfeldbacteria bacterium]